MARMVRADAIIGQLLCITSGIFINSSAVPGERYGYENSGVHIVSLREKDIEKTPILQQVNTVK
jgi:hypothetical protein